MTAQATRELAQQPLPQQPAIVRDWLRARRAAGNQAVNAILSGAYGPEYMEAMVSAMVDATAEPPIEVERAYREWADAYNAIANARNAERQARINAREVAKVRAAACPVCFTTHPGEC